MAGETQFDAGKGYEITVRGVLDREWSEWFDGMAIAYPGGDRTRLVGPVVDQAALYGLLCKIHDLGLVLISVQRRGDSVCDGEVRSRHDG
jgi:hypothetical protein